jgi:hypothetical protein
MSVPGTLNPGLYKTAGWECYNPPHWIIHQYHC